MTVYKGGKVVKSARSSPSPSSGGGGGGSSPPPTPTPKEELSETEKKYGEDRTWGGGSVGKRTSGGTAGGSGVYYNPSQVYGSGGTITRDVNGNIIKEELLPHQTTVKDPTSPTQSTYLFTSSDRPSAEYIGEVGKSIKTTTGRSARVKTRIYSTSPTISTSQRRSLGITTGFEMGLRRQLEKQNIEDIKSSLTSKLKQSKALQEQGYISKGGGVWEKPIFSDAPLVPQRSPTIFEGFSITKDTIYKFNAPLTIPSIPRKPYWSTATNKPTMIGANIMPFAYEFYKAESRGLLPSQNVTTTQKLLGEVIDFTHYEDAKKAIEKLNVKLAPYSSKLINIKGLEIQKNLAQSGRFSPLRTELIGFQYGLGMEIAKKPITFAATIGIGTAIGAGTKLASYTRTGEFVAKYVGAGLTGLWGGSITYNILSAETPFKRGEYIGRETVQATAFIGGIKIGSKLPIKTWTMRSTPITSGVIGKPPPTVKDLDIMALTTSSGGGKGVSFKGITKEQFNLDTKTSINVKYNNLEKIYYYDVGFEGNLKNLGQRGQFIFESTGKGVLKDVNIPARLEMSKSLLAIQSIKESPIDLNIVGAISKNKIIYGSRTVYQMTSTQKPVALLEAPYRMGLDTTKLEAWKQLDFLSKPNPYSNFGTTTEIKGYSDTFLKLKESKVFEAQFERFEQPFKYEIDVINYEGYGRSKTLFNRQNILENDITKFDVVQYDTLFKQSGVRIWKEPIIKYDLNVDNVRLLTYKGEPVEATLNTNNPYLNINEFYTNIKGTNIYKSLTALGEGQKGFTAFEKQGKLVVSSKSGKSYIERLRTKQLDFKSLDDYYKNPFELRTKNIQEKAISRLDFNRQLNQIYPTEKGDIVVKKVYKQSSIDKTSIVLEQNLKNIAQQSGKQIAINKAITEFSQSAKPNIITDSTTKTTSRGIIINYGYDTMMDLQAQLKQSTSKTSKQKNKINYGYDTMMDLQAQLKQKGIGKQKSIPTLKIKQIIDLNINIKSNLVLRSLSSTKSLSSNKFKQLQPLKQVQSLSTTQISLTSLDNIFGTSTNNIPTITPPNPFILTPPPTPPPDTTIDPELGFPLGRKKQRKSNSKSKRKKGKFTEKYQSDVTSRVFNIRGLKPTKQEYRSGLISRPIVR